MSYTSRGKGSRGGEGYLVSRNEEHGSSLRNRRSRDGYFPSHEQQRVSQPQFHESRQLKEDYRSISSNHQSRRPDERYECSREDTTESRSPSVEPQRGSQPQFRDARHPREGYTSLSSHYQSRPSGDGYGSSKGDNTTKSMDLSHQLHRGSQPAFHGSKQPRGGVRNFSSSHHQSRPTDDRYGSGRENNATKSRQYESGQKTVELENPYKRTRLDTKPHPQAPPVVQQSTKEFEVLLEKFSQEKEKVEKLKEKLNQMECLKMATKFRFMLETMEKVGRPGVIDEGTWCFRMTRSQKWKTMIDNRIEHPWIQEFVMFVNTDIENTVKILMDVCNSAIHHYYVTGKSDTRMFQIQQIQRAVECLERLEREMLPFYRGSSHFL